MRKASKKLTADYTHGTDMKRFHAVFLTGNFIYFIYEKNSPFTDASRSHTRFYNATRDRE